MAMSLDLKVVMAAQIRPLALTGGWKVSHRVLH